MSVVKYINQLVEAQQSTSAASLALTAAYNRYIFTGSSATTWTMMSILSCINQVVTIHNRGSASITLNSNEGEFDFSDLAVAKNQKMILQGETFAFYNDGTYFIIH